MGNICLSCYSP